MEKTLSEMKIRSEKTLRFRIVRYAGQTEDFCDVRTFVDADDIRGYRQGIMFPIRLLDEFLENAQKLRAEQTRNENGKANTEF